MEGDRRNNIKLKRMVKRYPKLTTAELQRVTGFSYAFCYGWTCAVTHSCYRIMPDCALRLLKLEMGTVRPAYRSLTKKA